MEKTIEKMNLTTNVKDELEKINLKTIYEYQKNIDNFEIEKVKIYTANENDKIVSFLFYDSDFFAVDRINYQTINTQTSNTIKSVEEPTEKMITTIEPVTEVTTEQTATIKTTKKQYIVVGENLNYKIRKIPNVAKTRKILNIEDIETRIYDVSEYIVLLKKEDIKLLSVENQTEIKDLKYTEYKLDIEKANNLLKEYEIQEIEELKEERSIKNRIKRITEKVKYAIVEPFKLLKSKLAKTNEIKMLSDGKHSIFDKED